MGRQGGEIDELGRALKAPPFGRTSRLVADSEPVTPTTVVLRLDQVEPYDHNPRQSDNPEYYRLKESIAARRGLTTPLTVTRRPDEGHYIVAAGGNSRLKALKEIFAETRDPAFEKVTCQFEPWESDCHVLASHLIENEIRGNMTFVDRARAVVHWCELYEIAHPEEAPLSQRALVERLNAAGFEISQTSLNRLLTAAEQLLPLLPKAFASGMGREAVDRVLRLKVLAAQYWQNAVDAGVAMPAIAFDTVFADVCARSDCHYDDWAHDIFFSTLAQLVSEFLGVDLKVVTLDLESLSRGLPVDLERPPHLDAVSEAKSEGWVFQRAREHLSERRARRRSGESADPDDTAASTAPPPASNDPGRDISAARDLIYGQAQDIAAGCSLATLILRCDTGYGYFVEPPDPPLAADGGRDADSGRLTDQASWAWWWLAACAQQFEKEHRTAIRRHCPDAWFAQLFDEAEQRLGTDPRRALAALVGQPDLGELGSGFLVGTVLSDPGFEALIDLSRSCRHLYRLANELGTSLWNP